MSATHNHVIDGKTFTYPNNACPICGTSQPQQQQAPSPAIAYRKGNTVVLKFSKASLLTVTYWEQQKCFLMTMSAIARDAQGKLMRSQDNKPIWNKTTRRVPLGALKSYVYELSSLLQTVGGGSNVPTRN